ncbi:MAG: hypothetical protein Q7S06_02355 [Nanoarchaeota archaeon]|nr:hypothetical protein [Nanoarchaeota archaeon]
MVMMGKKRGQFYLLAAIVIITILIGFSVVSNYSRNKEVVQLYDLKQELNIETAKVLEYGTYQQVDAQILLSDFAESYADYAGEGKNLYFFFGNFQEITAVAYQDLSRGEIKIKLTSSGGGHGQSTITETTLGGQAEMVNGQTWTYTIPEEFSDRQIHLLIEILEEEYPFRIKTGENFYFVLEQTVGEERYVVSG